MWKVLGLGDFCGVILSGLRHIARDRIENVFLVKNRKQLADRRKMLREYARSLCETANSTKYASKQAIEFTTKTYLETHRHSQKGTIVCLKASDSGGALQNH